MLLALVIGILSGLRSLAPLAIVAWAAHAGWLTLPPALAWLGGTVVTIILGVLALGELVADKLPMTPSRTALPPLIARAVTGGLAGAAVAGGPLGLVVGIVGALVGTFGGYRARMALTQALGSPLVAALLEDLVTIAGAFWVVTRV
jgi:uncharacterized membrane protein